MHKLEKHISRKVVSMFLINISLSNFFFRKLLCKRDDINMDATGMNRFSGLKRLTHSSHTINNQTTLAKKV